MPSSATFRPLSRPAAACLLLAASLGGCDLPLGAERTPRLALMGTVLRVDTGAPLPGARVGLLRYVDRGGYRDLEVAAEATADAQGRYTLSYPAAESECESLSLQATVDDWQNPNVSSEPEPDRKCTSGVQRVDVRLTFSAF